MVEECQESAKMDVGGRRVILSEEYQNVRSRVGGCHASSMCVKRSVG